MGIVGAKLLKRLAAQDRLSSLPDVIYLDSAHEPDETFLELTSCWDLLRPGGVLLGDDWGWEAISADVTRFAGTVSTSQDGMRRLAERHGPCTQEHGVLLLDHGQWAMVK